MKKKIVWLIAGLAILTAGGCSRQEKKEEKAPETIQENQTEQEGQNNQDSNTDKSDQITIGFSQAGTDVEWNRAVETSMNTAFAEEKGYQLLTENAGEEQEKQFDHIHSFIEEGVDYIIAAPLGESDQWEQVLGEAELAKIPVILIGNRIEIENEALYTAWIGSDYLQQGYDAGDWLEEYLKENGKNTEEIQIILAKAETSENTVIAERFQGFLEQMELSKQEHWEILDYQEKPAKVKKALQASEKPEVLICGDDKTALELLDMIGEDTIVVSFGASHEGIEAVRNGKIHADIECSPSYGDYAEDVISRLEAGDEIDKVQYVMDEVFTAENQQDMR